MGFGRDLAAYGGGWSWAFDTPFKWTKQVASHFGGTRQGMAISWPGHIKDVGVIRTQFHHLIDIVPTILDATGIQAPVMVNGIAQKPVEGVSMAYTFDKSNANAPSTHTTQYFEMQAIVPSTTTAGSPLPRPPKRLGIGLGQVAERVNEYNGSFTTSLTIIRRTTTSPPRCRTSCARCRNVFWSRRRNTTCCRWITSWSLAPFCRGRARPQVRQCSITR